MYGAQSALWAGLQAANPWWADGRVPAHLAPPFRREAFEEVFRAFRSAERGRGVVLLGPRRVGKSTIAYQAVAELIARGTNPADVLFVSFDDPALKIESIGRILDLHEARRPPGAEPRYLVLDEVQHAADWPLWLKRIADQAQPYRFLATGSAATALRKGEADAGVGRWRELALSPLSFREFARLRGSEAWSFPRHDEIEARVRAAAREGPVAFAGALRAIGAAPRDEVERLEAALEQYLLRGGFPELVAIDDAREVRRRLRQDILDRVLARDSPDQSIWDPRALERLFIRLCRRPGALWNESDAAKDLGIARQTVARYLNHLEDAFLVFRAPNLALRARGQPKVYPVDPAFKQAMFGIEREALVQPELWAPALENAILSALVAGRPAGARVGFWRRDRSECDAALVLPGAPVLVLEAKRFEARRADAESLRRAGEDLAEGDPVAGAGASFIAILLRGGAGEDARGGAAAERARGRAAAEGARASAPSGERPLGRGVLFELHPATWLYTWHPPE